MSTKEKKTSLAFYHISDTQQSKMYCQFNIKLRYLGDIITKRNIENKFEDIIFHKKSIPPTLEIKQTGALHIIRTAAPKTRVILKSPMK